jgi:FdhE protein
MPDRPPRRSRAESREVVELKQLKSERPELASAVEMQIELIEVHRRVQARVPLPRIQLDPQWLATQLIEGRPVVRFGDIPLDWTDFRLALRQNADVLLRYETLERAEYEGILALGRDAERLAPLVTDWYLATSRAGGPDTPPREPAPKLASLDQVLVLSIRPFLARSAEAVQQACGLDAWRYGYCPLCGWEPDFAVITPRADRRLICGRCQAQWTFAPLTCPFCANDDRGLISSFATKDGRYRVYACDRCRRYLKAYDARAQTRSVMLAVDTIATLPLDAAAMHRGYVA